MTSGEMACLENDGSEKHHDLIISRQQCTRSSSKQYFLYPTSDKRRTQTLYASIHRPTGTDRPSGKRR